MLEQLIPTPRLLEIDHVELAAPPERVWALLRHGNLAVSPLVRALFALRALPERLRGRHVDAAIRIDDMKSSVEHPGFQLLEENPGREFAVGAIGKVWRAEIPFVHVATGREFTHFAEPGFVKVAWAIRALPCGEHDCRVELEVRVDATDDDSWRKFRRYFRLIGPGSHFIRRTLLASLARELGTPEVEANARPCRDLGACAMLRSGSACRAGSHAAVCALFGAVLSGPVAMVVVNATHPQPTWQGPATFARSYHPIQTLPFFLGFFLVSGFVALVASLHAVAREEHRARTGTALAFVSAFAALVFSNYVIQTTFVPTLARHYAEANGPILAALTMANPASLGWGLEMWGYGLLGLATWLAAPVFRGSPLERATSWTFVANGPASIAPALLTAFHPGWVLTVPGLVSFAVWNLLVVAMGAMTFLVFRRRHAALAGRTERIAPAAGGLAL
jgi:hypothetical protein